MSLAKLLKTQHSTVHPCFAVVASSCQPVLRALAHGSLSLLDCLEAGVEDNFAILEYVFVNQDFLSS